jgi:hypothetical protein
MKRKLIRKNKHRISKRLRLSRGINLQSPFDASKVTFESISRTKQFGQSCHQTRIERQQKMNPRQLKKLRKRLSRLGIVGSKYGSICKTQLKPAKAILIKK